MYIPIIPSSKELSFGIILYFFMAVHEVLVIGSFHL